VERLSNVKHVKGDKWLDYCQQRWTGTKQNEITIRFNDTCKQIRITRVRISGVLLYIYIYIQGDSVARGPKLLSIKNYVIETMT